MKLKVLFGMPALVAATLASFASTGSATTYLVGPTRQYTAPSKVMSLVQDGDTVLVDAGLYSGDVGIWTKSNLVIKGVGGYAHLDAAGEYAGGKAIWVVQGSNTYIANIEFSGAAVPDLNGAGIRQEGTGLTLRHCYFHDNEDGVLAGDNANSDILFEACEFDHNGHGDGYSHNMYINHVRSFTLRFCYIHRANVGHEIKSRAYRTYVLYNRITDETDGTASYDIDLPNGGYAVIMGNVIQKGPMAQNHVIIRYGEEGQTNPIQELYVAYNTMVSQDSRATFIMPATATTTAVAVNNLFAGPGTLYGGQMDTLHNIRTTTAPGYGAPGRGLWSFVDSTKYDFHVNTSDVILNATGAAGTTSDGLSLTPAKQYRHPLDSESRSSDDYSFGAFQWNVLGSVAPTLTLLPVLVFPNPSDGASYIRLTDPTINGAWLHLVVCDELGRVIVDREVSVEGGQLALPSGLPAGNYNAIATDRTHTIHGRWIVR